MLILLELLPRDWPGVGEFVTDVKGRNEEHGEVTLTSREWHGKAELATDVKGMARNL